MCPSCRVSDWDCTLFWLGRQRGGDGHTYMYSTVQRQAREQAERRSEEGVRMAQEHYFPWRPGW